MLIHSSTGTLLMKSKGIGGEECVEVEDLELGFSWIVVFFSPEAKGAV